AAAAAAKPGIAATLHGILAVARDRITAGTELAAARAAVADRDAQLSALNAQLGAAHSQFSALNSQLCALCAHFGLKPAELTGKAAAEITALVDARISAAALDQVASMGLPTARLPAASAEAADAVTTLSHADFSKLPPPEKMKFCLAGGKIES
ncbi:MAG: hypothetical protein H7343_12335, partial [Undibacterium sp.]|nr:hypothetical protein [Opitutaceae bacterium]